MTNRKIMQVFVTPQKWKFETFCENLHADFEWFFKFIIHKDFLISDGIELNLTGY